MRARLRDRWWRRFPTWLALFLLGLSTYLLFLPGDLRNNADTVDRYMVTQRLVDHHTLEVVCGTWPGDARLVRGRHGCYYAIYAPGQTLLMAPLYLLGKSFAALTEPFSGSSLTPADIGANKAHEDLVESIFVRTLDPFLGALALVLFFLVALALRYSRRTAIILTLMLAFASTVFPDVQGGQEQIQSTLAILGLLLALMRVRQATGRRRTWWLLAIGASAGFGIFTRYDFWLVIAVFALVMIVSRLRRASWEPLLRHDAVPMVIGFLPFLVVDAAWNMIRFGAPWDVGQTIGGQFGTPIVIGALSLLVSTGKGLLWYLPLLWLVPFAWRWFHRRAPETAWLGVGLLVASLAFYGVLKYWNGDPAWGPRYLFPIVPVLLLPVGELVERFRGYRIGLKGAILGVVGLSLAVQVAAVSVDSWRFWYHLVERRQEQRVAFDLYPNTYDYYWSSSPGYSPLIYQFGAARDVLRIGLDRRVSLLGPTPAQSKMCKGISQTSRPVKFDQCVLWGLMLRPLNTVSPIWLNDRYQFVNAGPVPLQLVWRIIIIGSLSFVALVGATVLHLQFWRVDGNEDDLVPV
jgi:hypothetical protein